MCTHNIVGNVHDDECVTRKHERAHGKLAKASTFLTVLENDSKPMDQEFALAVPPPAPPHSTSASKYKIVTQSPLKESIVDGLLRSGKIK